jgi:uncharacterized protein
MTLREVREQRNRILEVASRYPVADVRVFGSVVRGEADHDSDLDFLIKTKPGCSLLHLGGMLQDLEDLLGCEVDLVTEEGLKPRLRERILVEASFDEECLDGAIS